MNKQAAFLIRNLSAVSFVFIYIAMVINHLIDDFFVPADQLSLVIIMLPFFLIGMALDFILWQNKALPAWVRVVAQLLPLGIFLMQLFSTITIYLGLTSLDLFNFLIWLFIALPFFIASYGKEGLRSRVLRALIGTGCFIIVYIILTTQTEVLNKNYGATIYFISYFFMLFTASGIKKFSYLGAVLGILNAAALLLLRYYPVTAGAKEYGWDYDIFGKVETLIMVVFVLCILSRLYEAAQARKDLIKT